MTKIALNILATKLVRGLSMAPVVATDGNKANLLLGQQCGGWWAIEQLKTLDHEAVDEDTELIPDYGAREIMEKAGYKKK